MLLATSPGPRGGTQVLKAAKDSAASFGTEVKADLSIPRFHNNFDWESGRLTNAEIRVQLESALATLNENI